VVEVRPTAHGLQVANRSLPRGAQLLVGWTGTSAHTPPLLARFADMPAPAAFQVLVETAEAAADAVRSDDVAGLCDAVRAAGESLERFGDEAGLPIVTPALRRLLDAARTAGAVAKPSGAGGGDCGIALATSPVVAAAVRAAWREAGVLPLDVTVAGEGVAVG
jgi:phosphomevalonate kinase